MMVSEEEVADIGHTIAATGLGGIINTGVIGITIGVHGAGAENRRKTIETFFLEFKEVNLNEEKRCGQLIRLFPH